MVRNYRRIKETRQSIDEALLDHLKCLRIERNQVEHTTTLLLTYARTVPARDHKYPLRALAEVRGIPISSIRDRISEIEMEEIEGLLDFDDERLSRLDSKRDKKDSAELNIVSPQTRGLHCVRRPSVERTLRRMAQARSPECS